MNSPASPPKAGTHLRDARLNMALTHAPDAHDLPEASTKIAIQNIAIKSIQVSHKYQNSNKFRWWQHLWNSWGRQHSPRGAVLATLLLGGIITLLWHGQEIPGTTPKLTQPEKAQPAQSRAKAKPTEPARSEEKLYSAATEAPAAKDISATPLPKALPLPTTPTASPVAAPTTAAPSVAMRRQSANDVELPPWNGATVKANGKTVTLSGAQLRPLTNAVTQLIQRSLQVAEGLPPEPATLRMTLLTSTGEQSVLELWPQVLRWQTGGQDAQLRLADEASAQALRSEAARLLAP